MYKVVLLPAGCGQNALDTRAIEQNANTMSSQGFDLHHIYQTSTASCVGSKSAVVMIFRQRGT
jgi:hypothetical protein